MLESILGVSTDTTISDLGALAALTTLIVQILKKKLPSSFPTKILTIIVAIVISFIASLLYCGTLLKAIVMGILMGTVVAYVAMNGFDSVKSIWNRFQNNGTSTEDEDETDGEG